MDDLGGTPTIVKKPPYEFNICIQTCSTICRQEATRRLRDEPRKLKTNELVQAAQPWRISPTYPVVNGGSHESEILGYSEIP